MEIICSEAILNIPTPFKPGVKSEITLTRGGKVETLKIKGQELYLGEVEDMCDAVLLGKPPRISLADSRGNIAAILGLFESAQHGKNMPLSAIFV
jgi:predicted dehydrogenase